MSFIETLAQQTAGQVVGAGMGMATAGWQDRRQRKQAEKLQNIQIKGQKEMGEFNYSKQKQFWDETNYAAQMAHIKGAGLNPALIYGQSGAGGSTISGPASGGVGGSQAAGGSGEIMQGMGMQMNAAITAAQVKVLESQAELNKVEAAKKGGVDTELAGAQIKSLTQGINNAKAQEILTKADTNLRNMQVFKEGATMDAQIDEIEWNAERAMQLVLQARQETYIGSEVINEKIRIIQEEAIGAGLRNILTKSQTRQTDAATDKARSDIHVNNATISKWVQELQQGWTALAQNEKRLKIESFKANIQKEYPGLFDVGGKMLDQFLENILDLTGRKGWKPQKVED